MNNQQTFIGYFRVSTKGQADSGLGLSAQKKVVENYVHNHNGRLLEYFTEVESGSRSDRPKFIQACDMAELTNSILICSKLDRLTRDLNLLTSLQKRGLKFRIAELPQVDELTVNLLGAVGQHELRMISSRTKQALEQARLKGVRLGNPRIDLIRNCDVSRANEVRTKKQFDWRSKVLRIIAALEMEGYESCKDIAEQLNERGIKTSRGCQFSIATISRLRRHKS